MCAASNFYVYFISTTFISIARFLSFSFTYLQVATCVLFLFGSLVSQHLVNHYMVVCKRSRSHNSNIVSHTLQENTECALRNKRIKRILNAVYDYLLL